MAKYIELVGAPGVGKTSSYQHLRSHHSPGARWIPWEKLYKESHFAASKGLIAQLKRIIQKGVGLHKYRTDYDVKLTDRFIINNSAFLDLFWQLVPTIKAIQGKDLRFHIVKYFLTLIQKTQIIKEIQSDKYAIIDEGLMNAIITYLGTCSSEEEDKKQTQKILDSLILPDALIIFGANIETIMERSLNRGYLIAKDGFLTIEELKQSRMTYLKKLEVFHECLQEKEIPLLYLEATESLELKSQKIEEFINRL